MEDKIKKSYSDIKMAEESKERIHRQILQTDYDGGMAGKIFQGGKVHKMGLSGWKMGIAACLGAALIIPTGVYAAGKISEYVTVTIGKDKYQAKVKLHKEDKTLVLGMEDKDMQYIQVKADFGPDYKPDDKTSYLVDGEGNVAEIAEKIQEGSNGMYCYNHKDGFEAGKDFYYNVIYMDEDGDAILNLYDQSCVQELEVNGHRALFCESNTVKGSRYASDYNTSYTLDIYVFYEEYGYIIDYCGMQGLGQDKLISLAEKTTVTETSRKKASRYEFLSKFRKADTEKADGESARTEVTSPVKRQSDVVEYSGISYQVTDIRVSSKVVESDAADYNPAQFSEECRGLWDENGKLKPYIREKVKSGDGVSEPEKSVTGEEQIQPKIVYVTMKVKVTGEDTTFQLPSIAFFEKNGEKYYDTKLYWQYNRPEKIENALIDFMPCYFKETDGGKGYWLKKMKSGEEQVFHFAYVVDGDMTDSMYLHLDDVAVPNHCPYVDISQ